MAEDEPQVPECADPAARRVVRRIGAEFEQVGDGRYQNCNVLHFDGNEYVFSHRAILTLVTTAACNAACKFCSNEVTFTPSGPYLAPSPQLERTVAFAELAGVTKVAYTGGEPTAAPQKLYDLVRTVSPRFRRSRLHTNGFGLPRPVQTPDGERALLPALIDAGMTGVSVSVASHITEDNHRVMRLKGKWDGLSDDDLRYISAHSDERFSPRLSCVLTHESVLTADDIIGYVDWGVGLGFRRFIFRSCSQIPDEFTKVTDFSDFNSSSYIPIEPIVLRLREHGDFRETYQQHKTDSHVHVFERSDGVVIDIDESSEEVDPDPKIRRLNVMPDGVTYTSWIDPRSWLFPDEADRAATSIRKELPLLLAGGCGDGAGRLGGDAVGATAGGGPAGEGRP